MERPEWIDAHVEVCVWPGIDAVSVACGQEVVELHVGVSDEVLDALLDDVTRRRGRLDDRDEPSDLVVTRGGRLVALIRRRPGQEPEVMRCRAAAG